MIRIGVLADVHGAVDIVQHFAAKFDTLGADLVVLNGDLCTTGSSYRQIYRVLLHVCKRVSCPIIVFPGNYESYSDYTRAIQSLKRFKHLIDGRKVRRFALGEYDFLTLPASTVAAHHAGFHLLNDRRSTKSFQAHIKTHKEWYGKGKHEFFYVRDLKKYARSRTTILLTHEPPLSIRKHGVDIAIFPQEEGIAMLRTGNALLRKFIKERKEIVASISGHIHESFGGCTIGGTHVPEHRWSKKLLLNPGPAFQGLAALVEVEKNKSRYTLFQF